MEGFLGDYLHRVGVQGSLRGASKSRERTHGSVSNNPGSREAEAWQGGARHVALQCTAKMPSLLRGRAGCRGPLCWGHQAGPGQNAELRDGARSAGAAGVQRQEPENPALLLPALRSPHSIDTPRAAWRMPRCWGSSAQTGGCSAPSFPPWGNGLCQHPWVLGVAPFMQHHEDEAGCRGGGRWSFRALLSTCTTQAWLWGQFGAGWTPSMAGEGAGGHAARTEVCSTMVSLLSGR